MEQLQGKRKGLNGSTLKIIAIVTMLIDHVGAIIAKEFVYSLLGNQEAVYIAMNIMNVMRSIGRLSFPIFCFLLVEGFYHTKNVKKYAFRLLLFAIVSEIPFDLAFNGMFLEFGSQNIFFTLFIAVLMMWAIEYFKNKFIENRQLYIILSTVVMVLATLLADYINCDYNSVGVIVILIMYLFKDNKILKTVSVSLVFAIFSNFGRQSLAGLAFIPILMYNGEKGLSLKYFFYVFYPAHLIILWFLTRFIS